jgi:hypothetical protein
MAIRACVDQAELIAALEDTSHLVVEAAAERVNQPRAIPALLRAYLRLDKGAPGADPGCRSRMAILGALSRLESHEASDIARRAIRTVQVEMVGFGLEDTGIGLRSLGAGLLALLRPPGALLELALLLNDFEPNTNCSVLERPFAKRGPRAAAARSMGALGDPGGIALLAVKLAYPGPEIPEVLSECMDAIVALEDRAGAEFLVPYLTHLDPYLAATAATGLATLLRSQAIPHLESALESATPGARPSLVYAIASIRGDETRACLLRLSKHSDSAISQTAAEQL